jgi:thioredoxin-related protein
MRKMIVLACLALGLATTSVSAQQATTTQQAIQWQPDYATAQCVASCFNRPLLVYFSTAFCPYCKRMASETLNQPDLIRIINTNFVPVSINPNMAKDLAIQFGLQKTGVPTMFLVYPQGQQEHISGFMTANKYAFILNHIVDRYAKSVQQQQQRHDIKTFLFPRLHCFRWLISQRLFIVRAQCEEEKSANELTDAPYKRRPRIFLRGRRSRVRNAMCNCADSSAVNSATIPQQTEKQAPPNPIPSISATKPNLGLRLGLMGYCPVTLSEKRMWVKGDERWGACHLGRLYFFVGLQERQQFLAAPNLYAPAFDGNDVVLAVEQYQLVPGDVRFCCWYDNHLYLFFSKTVLERFSSNPAAYANQDKINQSTNKNPLR